MDTVFGGFITFVTLSIAAVGIKWKRDNEVSLSEMESRHDSTISEMESRHDSKISEMESRHDSEQSELRSKLEDAAAHILQIARKLVDLDGTCERQRASMALQADEIALLQMSKAAIEAELASLKQTALKKDADIAGLTMANKALGKKFTTVLSHLATKEKELAAAEVAYQALEAKLFAEQERFALYAPVISGYKQLLKKEVTRKALLRLASNTDGIRGQGPATAALSKMHDMMLAEDDEEDQEAGPALKLNANLN